MKAFLGFLLAIVLAVGLALLLASKPGYVLISYGKTEVQFTFFAFSCIFIVSTILASLLWFLIRKIYRLPRWLATTRTRGSERASGRALTRGLQAYSKGRYRSAQRLMDQAAKGALRVPGFLGAAYAAEAGNEVTARDRYLMLITKSNVRLGRLVLLVRATFEINRGEWERASATIRALQERGDSNAEVQRKALQVACKLQDYDSMVAHLTVLGKSSSLPESEIRSCVVKALGYRLGDRSADAKQLWDSMPRAWKGWAEVRRVIALALATQEHSKEALRILRENLRTGYSVEDVEALARLVQLAPEVRAKELAQLRDRYGSRAELLRESGRVAIESGLWGQAKTFLESAGTPAEDPELARLLGRLAEKERRLEAAVSDYRVGLDRALGRPLNTRD